jgi:hypothetical protein
MRMYTYNICAIRKILLKDFLLKKLYKLLNIS